MERAGRAGGGDGADARRGGEMAGGGGGRVRRDARGRNPRAFWIRGRGLFLLLQGLEAVELVGVFCGFGVVFDDGL